MKIRAFAASDRNNYGDLLFPLIIKKYLEKYSRNFKFYNYGVIESDLSDFGALPTLSFSDLNKDVKTDHQKSVVVIAGGEVLGGTWLNIYRFISKSYNYIYHNRFLHYVFRKTRILERVHLVLKSSSVPFVLDGDNFSKAKIVYNSVGALGVSKLLKQQKYIKYFKNVNNLSVRDKHSQTQFSKVGIDAKLVPDSALLMSDFFLKELDSVSEKCKGLAEKKYIFLQLGNKKGPDNIDDFVKNIKRFADKHHLEIILCPIGLALDHSDDVLLKKIHDSYPGIFTYFYPNNLFEIMYLLKNSKLYLGTSLHGFVTSQSFNVPFFIFPQKIEKLKYYLDTWFENSKEKYGSFEDFDKVEKLFINFNHDLENENTLKHKKLVLQNLSSFLI